MSELLKKAIDNFEIYENENTSDIVNEVIEKLREIEEEKKKLNESKSIEINCLYKKQLIQNEEIETFNFNKKISNK